MDFTEKLIALVQPNRCLYDCREKDYKNALKKDILWEQISKNLNQSRDAIKSKWKNLKDGYTKYKKNMKGTTGQKKMYTNWVWGPYLTFLDDAIETRSTSSNVTISSQSSSSAEVEVEISEIGSAELNTYTSSANDEWTEETLLRNEPVSRSSRKRQHDIQDNILVDKILTYIDSKEKKGAIDLLFASYANSLKRMKPATQASVKIKLAHIFAEAELQDVQTEKEQEVAISVTSPMYSVQTQNQQEVPMSVVSPLYFTNSDSQHSVSNDPEDLSTSTILLVNNE